MAPVRPLLSCVLLVLGLAAGASPAAEPVRYTLDPVHTRVLLSLSHAGFSQAMGTVAGSEGELHFDPADWSTATLDVRVPLARVNFGDAKWNRAVRGRNLLDVAKHPVARFVSSRVTPRDERHAQVCGELTLHGVTRPLCLDVTFNQLRRHPFPPFRPTAGFSATGTLKRSDFGIVAWKTVVGDEVALRIEAEAYVGRARRSALPEAPAPDATPADMPAEDADVPEASETTASDVPPGADDPASHSPTRPY